MDAEVSSGVQDQVIHLAHRGELRAKQPAAERAGVPPTTSVTRWSYLHTRSTVARVVRKIVHALSRP
jgi:hypothetical protein